MDLEIDELFRKLRPVLGDKLDALWLEYQLNPRRRSEIEGFLQLLAAKHLGKPGSTRPVLLEPPVAEQSQGDYPLGTVLYGEREVGPFGLRQDEWIQHVGIFGRTGSGKTNVGFVVAKELLAKGIPILVFDWKRNYRDLVQIDAGPLTVYTVGRPIAPFTFNPLIPPKGTAPTVWLKKLIEIMCHVYWLGEGVAYLLQVAIDAVYQEFRVYESQPTRYPTLADVKVWLDKYKAKGREAQWMDSTRRVLGTLCYGDIGRVLSSGMPTGLAGLLRRNVVLELDALTNNDKTFLIEALLLWVHHFRIQEQGRETLKHAILIEEAHHVLLKRKESKESVTDVILREIRELGESIILIDQHPSLISIPSLGNTNCTIAMNLKHGSDVATIANAMLLGLDEREYLGRLPVGQAVVRLQGRWYKPFHVKFPLLQIQKGKVTDSDLARQSLGDSGEVGEMRPSESKREEILQIRAAEKVGKEELELLKDVMDNITSSIVERYSRLGLSAHRGTRLCRSVIGQGLIEALDIPAGKSRVRLLSLTEKGKETLVAHGFEAPACGRGGPEHEYWKDRVGQHLRNLSYDVEVEKPIGGGKSIDIVATKNGQAIAIELETGMSDVETNVTKCVESGYGEVLILAIRRDLVSRISRQVKRAAASDLANVLVADVHHLDSTIRAVAHNHRSERQHEGTRT